MKKIMVILLLILAGCSSINPMSSKTTIDWIDIIMWNDTKYTNNYDVNDLNQTWKTGKELGEITYEMSDHAKANHVMQNGHAAFLSPGTKLYEMTGYNPAFRIFADGKVYEVQEPDEAESLGDFLDIAGKVESVWFLSEQDHSPLFQMDNAVAQTFTDQFLLLDYTPYDKIHEQASGSRTFIEFRLQDGTSMQTVFWIESKVFTSGAIGTDAIQEIIEKELMTLTE